MDNLNIFSLKGKNAWITGASYGIGFNIAKAFAAAGIDHIIFNDINQDLVDRGMASYKEAGIANVTGYVCDVTKENDVKALVERIHKEVGNIDILVNNAGVLERGSVETLGIDAFDRVFAVNVRAVYAGVQAAGRCRRCVDRCRQRRGVCAVHPTRISTAALACYIRSQRFRRGRRICIGKSYVGSLRGEPADDGRADTAGAARDECGLASQYLMIHGAPYSGPIGQLLGKRKGGIRIRHSGLRGGV